MRNRGGFICVFVALLVLLPISAWCSLYEYDFSEATDAAEWKYMAPGWSPTDRFSPDPAQFPASYNFYPFLEANDSWYPLGLTESGLTYPAIRFPREGTEAHPGFEGYDSRFAMTNYLPFVNNARDINFQQYHVIKAVMRADTPNWNSANAKIGFYIGVGQNRYHYILEEFKPNQPWQGLSFDLATGYDQPGYEDLWWQFSWNPANPVGTPFTKSLLINPDEFGWFVTANPPQSSSVPGDLYMGFFSADVPAPPALLLLPIGLAGAMVARRRRREQTD